MRKVGACMLFIVIVMRCQIANESSTVSRINDSTGLEYGHMGLKMLRKMIAYSILCFFGGDIPAARLL